MLCGCGQHVDVPSQVELAAAFKQKQECQSYQTEIENRLKKHDQEKSGADLSAFSRLKKIFYSKKRNSCLYIWNEDIFTEGRGNSNYMWIHHLSDVLTAEEITNAGPLNAQTPNSGLMELEFDKKVSEYETE
jgi:hypothetical protein